MNSQAELEFLKDQVTRLNGQLSYYQSMFLEKVEKAGPNQIKTILNNHTAPLLSEYDKVISELTEELHRYKDELVQEQAKVRSIVNENERLWEQLRGQSVAGSARVTTDGGGGRPTRTGDDASIVENLQRQLELLRQEKTSLEDALRLAGGEVDRMQGILDETNSRPEAIVFNDRLVALRRQFAETERELEMQLAAYKDTNRDLQNELEQLHGEIQELQRQCGAHQEQLKFEKEAAQENDAQLRGAMRRIEFLEQEKKQLQAQVGELKTNRLNEQSGADEWSEALRHLEHRCRDKDAQAQQLTDKISEMQRLLESVEADRQAVETREQHMTRESERLRGVISGLLEDAGARTRQEIETVRGTYDGEMERLLDELRYCEENRQELIIQVDQLKRSKTQIEQDIEKIHQAEKERDLKEQSSTEVYQERTLRAEREKEKMRLELESTNSTLEKQRKETALRYESYDADVQQLRQKVCQSTTALDRAQTEASQSSSLLAIAEEASRKALLEHRKQLRASRHELELARQTAAIRQQELTARLTAGEDVRVRWQDEMRHLLVKQQQMSSKWQEEAHALTDQYEEKINQLTKEMERLKKRTTEMGQLLHEAKQKILENEECINEKVKTINNLEEKLNMCDGNKAFKLENCDEDDARWQLKQLKMKQQKLIKDTVARKYHFS